MSQICSIFQTETTVYKTSATDVTKESKLSEGTSKHFERSDKNRGAHWNEKDMIGEFIRCRVEYMVKGIFICS